MARKAGKHSQAVIRASALRLLARREHAEGELVSKLTARGYPAGGIAEVLSMLKEQGLQSDTRYVETYITSRISKGYGPLHILHALRQRGIAAALAQHYLQAPVHHWHQLAAAVRSKRFGAARPKDYQARHRQARFLRYRGFTGEQIAACLRDE